MKFLLIDNFELIPFENILLITVYTDKEITKLGIKLKNETLYTYTLYSTPLRELEKEEVLNEISKLFSRNSRILKIEEILSRCQQRITELRNPQQQTKRGRKRK